MIELKDIRSITFYVGEQDCGFYIHMDGVIKNLIKFSDLHFLADMNKLDNNPALGLVLINERSEELLNYDELTSILSVIEEYYEDSIDKVSYGTITYPEKRFTVVSQG